MLDQDALSLPDSVAAIFGLRDVARYPVQLGKNYVGRRRQRDTDACRHDRTDKRCHLASLESVHACLAFGPAHVSRDYDGCDLRLCESGHDLCHHIFVMRENYYAP